MVTPKGCSVSSCASSISSTTLINFNLADRCISSPVIITANHTIPFINMVTFRIIISGRKNNFLLTITIQIANCHCSWVVSIMGCYNWGSPYYIKGIISSIVFKNHYSAPSIIIRNNFLFSITVHIHSADNGSSIVTKN